MGQRAAHLKAPGATRLVAVATLDEMADAGEGPLVVHRPDDAFPAPQDRAEIVEGQEALAGPVQMDDIGPLELMPLRDVHARVCQAQFPQPAHAETVRHEDAHPLPCLAPQAGMHTADAPVGALPVAHQHTCLHSIATEGIHQPARRNGCTALSLTCTYNQDFHQVQKYK